MYTGEFAPHFRHDQERRLRRSHHAPRVGRRRGDGDDLGRVRHGRKDH